ncbi:Site-specific recombinase XerD [Thermanaeromonas toyohensis ToBE]|uniref:Site-specific recombinase XerD n=1 Tax=Thermanaeromonas toyohensis ToBE TaxID=698762 RepID=A0A1W1W0N8_9FIRM|nr:site-specific integrase [Thermanaeromonas toyohensis]SMB99060.1 Site-specific recombinase XerD [Thermanaeromonas toyohensis ToBE]
MARVLRINPREKFATWEDALSAFLREKQAGGLAERSLNDYEWHIRRFFAHRPDAWSQPEALEEAVLEYFARLAPSKPSFFNTARRKLNTFFRWAMHIGIIPSNPVVKVRQRREGETPRAAAEEELAALVSFLKRRQDTFTGLRDLALLLFSLDTGTRPSEALALLPEHFNLRSYEAYIPAHISKTRLPRTVVFNAQTAKYLARLINARPAAWGPAVPVFCSENGQRMLVSSWAHRLKRYSRELGINVTPYTLRHSAAILALRSGATAFYVQRQLGHTSLNTTRRYTVLVEADLHRENAQCSPVNRLLQVRERVRKL